MSSSKLEARDAAGAHAPPVLPPDGRVDRTVVIKPASRWPHLDIAELWHYRELLQTLVWRDVVVRYKQTFLGIAWAILVPIFTAVVYIIVFGKFANFPAGEVSYPVLVIGGVLPMQYFASSLTGSSLSLAGNLQLVTKVYFPRALLPLAVGDRADGRPLRRASRCSSRLCGSTRHGREASKCSWRPSSWGWRS